jgi:hypothetical protein
MRRSLVGAALLLLGAGVVHAEVAFDVAVGMNLNEDTRLFLNVTNQTWRPPIATTVIQGCADPEEDFPVIAFLAYHSHRSPTFILNLRREGYSWADVFFQVNVNPSVLFVGIERDPGPPYGKAWGYWRKHYRSGARVRYRLADRDVAGLVKVQTVSRHFGATPFSIIEAQRGGRRPEIYTAQKWRQKNGRATWAHGPARGAGMKGKNQGPSEDRAYRTHEGGHGAGGSGKETHPSEPPSKKKNQEKEHGKGNGKN